VRCPDDGDTPGVTVLEIMRKIRWESLMWGFGTALGELPPYFMARAARISGMADDEDLEKFNELLMRKKRTDPNTMVSGRVSIIFILGFDSLLLANVCCRVLWSV